MSGYLVPLFHNLGKRLRLKRIALRFVLPLIFLLAIFYQVENFRGRQDVEQTSREIAAEGESLNLGDFLNPAPPAGDNFGATPFLDGIMLLESPDKIAPSRVWMNRDRFAKLCAVVLAKPSPESTAPGIIVPKEVDWKATRRAQSFHPKRKPPADEASDVRAIDQVLDLRRDVFEELALAAKRPRAVFTPVRLNRPFQKNLTFPYFEGTRTLQLRIQAATSLGRLREAGGLTRVFWRLREATLHESGFPGYIWAGKAGAEWCDGVVCLLRSPKRDAALLAELQSHIPADWSPEHEMLQASRFSAANINFAWNRILEQATNQFWGDLDGQFVERFFDDTKLALYSPVGWLSQNAAESLRLHHRYRLQPLRKMDMALLPAAQATLPPPFSQLSPYRRWVPDDNHQADLEFAVCDTMRIRLTLLTLTMERYRLEAGRYPGSVQDLVPEFTRSIPPDIDGQPLRLLTSPDGGKAVVYSIGWNLKDDWQGHPPASVEKGTLPSLQPDWTITLPFSQVPES